MRGEDRPEAFAARLEPGAYAVFKGQRCEEAWRSAVSYLLAERGLRLVPVLAGAPLPLFGDGADVATAAEVALAAKHAPRALLRVGTGAQA